MKYIIIFFLVAILGCSQAVSVEEKGQASDFILDDLEGSKVSLSDLSKEKPVLLVFWATWCPFCIEEIPALNKIADAHKDKVGIAGIDIKENVEKVKSFAQKKEIKYSILLDSTGSVAQKYGVLGIPTNVLIDKDGKILYSGHSIEEVEKIIEKL